MSSRCLVELACMEASDQLEVSKVPSSKKSTRKVPRTPEMGTTSIPDKSKWDVLSKELSQK